MTEIATSRGCSWHHRAAVCDRCKHIAPTIVAEQPDVLWTVYRVGNAHRFYLGGQVYDKEGVIMGVARNPTFPIRYPLRLANGLRLLPLKEPVVKEVHVARDERAPRVRRVGWTRRKREGFRYRNGMMRWDEYVALKAFIFKRDGFKCVACGHKGSTDNFLTLDHIFPLSKGGKDDRANLQTMCFNCNQAKGDSVEVTAATAIQTTMRES